MATVEMTFTPLPAHVRTARLVATTVARRSGVSDALLDEVRLAVGEACSHAVEVHQAHCPDEPVRVALTGADGRFEVVVTNTAAGSPGPDASWGQPPLPSNGEVSPSGARADSDVPLAPGSPASAGWDYAADGLEGEPDASGLPPGMRYELGLAVIAGLADDVQVARTGNGISIRMSWPAAGTGAAG